MKGKSKKDKRQKGVLSFVLYALAAVWNGKRQTTQSKAERTRGIWYEILESADLMIASSNATLTDPRADYMTRTIAASNLAFAESQAARARTALESEVTT